MLRVRSRRATLGAERRVSFLTLVLLVLFLFLWVRGMLWNGYVHGRPEELGHGGVHEFYHEEEPEEGREEEVDAEEREERLEDPGRFQQGAAKAVVVSPGSCVFFIGVELGVGSHFLVFSVEGIWGREGEVASWIHMATRYIGL